MSKHGFPLETLLGWGEKNGRRPPWRGSTDPFSVALAEVLLQKTKAEAVEGAWRGIVSLFPTPASLCRASDGQVHQIVRHLGLGRQRTTRLKAMARDWETLWHSETSLPGLGPYGTAVVRLTAGLDEAFVPIDGNIARIFSRYCGFKVSGSAGAR